MKNIKEIELNDERAFLKKNFLGWNIVYPTNWILKKNGLNPLDKKTNLRNLIAGGSWWRLVLVALFVIIILGCLFEFNTTYAVAQQCLNQSKNFIINP